MLVFAHHRLRILNAYTQLRDSGFIRKFKTTNSKPRKIASKIPCMGNMLEVVIQLNLARARVWISCNILTTYTRDSKPPCLFKECVRLLYKPNYLRGLSSG